MKHNLSQLFDRFKDAPWFSKSKEETISVLGAGGIGSNTIYNLCKTIPATYIIVDFDRVEPHNVGTQFFSMDQIGKLKVEAIRDTILDSVFARLRIYPIKIDDAVSFSLNEEIIRPITITGFDNMKARKDAFNAWCNQVDRELFIDGRLRANLYEVYAVTPDKEEQYRTTLFEDDDVLPEPCTFKQTAYFGMLIGARITNVVVNYLSNKYSDTPVNIVPFKIKEIGELCYVEIV